MKLHIMIDSGAFSAWTQKDTIDLDAYISFCQKVLRQDPSIEIINLDVIDNAEASYANWITMRKAGVPAWPVYHFRSPVVWLEKYLEQTDKLALGGTVTFSTPGRTQVLDRLWVDHLTDSHTGMPKVKVHGLALTTFSLMKRYPWYSFDSTSAMRAGIYGSILLPHRVRGEWDYSRPPRNIYVSEGSPHKGRRGFHMETLSPRARDEVLTYLKSLGVTYGHQERRGVHNSYRLRVYVNMIFFARFVGRLVWPRPLAVPGGRRRLI